MLAPAHHPQCLRFQVELDYPNGTTLVPLPAVVCEAKGYLPAELLLCVARQGHAALVTVLLDSGVSTYEVDPELNTPLHLAAAANQRAVCKVCLPDPLVCARGVAGSEGG